jgi:regulator of protease activity HflC (stomatin/prohibitin superfamily)
MNDNFRDFFNSSSSQENPMEPLKKLFNHSLLWLLAALILIVGFTFYTFRFEEITGEEVGVILNKLNGNMSIVNNPGVKPYCGLTHQLFVLDKTIQVLEMTERQGRGDRQGKDNLKIKAIDGSDVYVDLKVQYRIDPEMADVVLRTSGIGDAYKQKWVRDYVRSYVRNKLGQLTTEAFYDASEREPLLAEAQSSINEKLAPFGIIIDQPVIPRKPHFHEAYEELIKQKKLADQQVLEEESKKKAAEQRQQTLIVEAENRKRVALTEFDGKMKQKVIAAEAEAERIVQEGEAYYQEITIGAEAILYESQKKAESIRKEKKAEAEGMAALNKALKGEGGRNMVMLEYAKRLSEITFSGLPYKIDQTVEKFEHTDAAASIKQAKPKKAPKQ